MILWLLACTASEPKLDTAGLTAVTPSTASSVVDTASPDTAGVSSPGSTSSTGTASTDADPYQGRLLKPPLPPPAFAVVNQDGDARTPEWLAGAPTVLWFYRDASDAG